MAGEGHPKGSSKAYAVGECSYKVFLDIGGEPKRKDQRYPNNNWLTSFIVFPGSQTSQLLKLSLAENAEDFGVFLALQADADRHAKGHSGLRAFKKYVADGRKTKPATYQSIVSALQPLGYTPGLAAVVSAASAAASSLASAIGQVIP